MGETAPNAADFATSAGSETEERQPEAVNGGESRRQPSPIERPIAAGIRKSRRAPSMARPDIPAVDATIGAPRDSATRKDESGPILQTNLRSQPSRATRGADDMQNVQLLGEVLEVHKEKIKRGDVVVRKEIVTETKTIQVPVEREELVIEQQSAGGDNGEQIRIPLTEETASVDKRTVVREEIAVGKKPVHEIRNMTTDVKHEELLVDDRTKPTSGK